MQNALPILELQYLDASGSKGALSVKFPLGTTVAVMDAQASALASFIAPLTGAVLIRQRIIFKAVTFPRDVAEVGSSIHNSGTFFFSCGEEEPLALFGIPAIRGDIFLTSGPSAGYTIDGANIDVAALITLIEDDIYTNIFGDDIVEIKAKYRQSRS